MSRSSSGATDNKPVNSDRERWNKKYGEASAATWKVPDPFLPWAFSQYILPMFPHGGSALDLAGGAGRHAVWLAAQGWEVTLIDISDAGVDLARQSAGLVVSRVHFVVDDLTQFKASQTRFDIAMVFFYLDRNIFSEIVKSLRPGGLLIYKTNRVTAAPRMGESANPAYLLKAGELVQLLKPGAGMRVLHHREDASRKATAELIAQKEMEAGGGSC
jgi:SAM-dependent methyltransferase